MRRRTVLLLALLLVVLTLLHPAVHWRLIGWARREAFYQGRPTTYWRLECKHWEPTAITSFFSSRIWWRRQNSDWQRWLDFVPGMQKDTECPLTQGDPECLAVLLELLETSGKKERLMAINGLGKIGPGARAALPTVLAIYRASDPPNYWVWQALKGIDPDTAAAEKTAPRGGLPDALRFDTEKQSKRE